MEEAQRRKTEKTELKVAKALGLVVENDALLSKLLGLDADV